jgi:adenosylhomocysteine nucleosidase
VTILAVTGLLSEAGIARRAGLQTICAGGRPERTAAALADTLAASPHPPHALLSFGIAGGLDPILPTGAVIAASAVLVEGRRVAATWRLPVGESRDIAAEPAIVATVAGKATLFRQTQAAAVDLESGVVALAAERAGVPFGALRVIADTAGEELPPAVLVGLTPEGAPAVGPVLRSLAARPGQLPALIRTAGETRRALKALVGACCVLDGLFRRVDAGERLFDMA